MKSLFRSLILSLLFLCLLSAAVQGAGNSFATASPISFNKSYSGSLSSSSYSHYYSFTLPASGEVSFQVNITAGGSYSGATYWLFDSQENQVKRQNGIGGFDQTYSLSAGSYYFLISRQSTDFSYSLTISCNIDSTAPTASILSENKVASSQMITLKLRDNLGIAGYYWGTSSNYLSNSYTSVNSATQLSLSHTVSSPGTYYLVCKDLFGNVSVAASATFYRTTLNANQGSVSPASILTLKGYSFTFPVPTRANCGYRGWAQSKNAASGVMNLSPTGNSTYYALWIVPNTAVPPAPILRNKTDTTVILEAIEGCEYSMDASAWQSSPEFTGLKPYTSYNFYCRYKKTADMYASAPSEALSVCTDRPAPVEGIPLYHTLTLASDISVNYIVEAALLDEYDSFYLQCSIARYDGNTYTGTISVKPTKELVSGYYYFTLDCLSAIHMNDSIEAVLYMEKDGIPYHTPTDTYSIAIYAYRQLDKVESPNALKCLCADLLQYGAAAQVYKKYRTDALANGVMTPEQAAYTKDPESVSFNNVDQKLGDLPQVMIPWVGKSLLLEHKVAVRFVFDASNYSGNIEDLYLQVSYTDCMGEEKTVLVTEAQQYSQEQNYWSFTFNDFRAAELRQILSAAIYGGETQLSETWQYSADTYGNGKSGTLGNLCRALIAYSDSAKSYFVSQ